MKYQSYIQDLLVDLVKAHVDFVVAGGVAVVLQGIDRATMDIDLSLDLKTENLARFLEVMGRHGMKPRAPVTAQFILDPENLNRAVQEKHARVFTFQDPTLSYKQIDFFLTEDLSFQRFKDKCDKIVLGGHEVKVLSVEQLIYTKELIIPPRSKDLLDLEELRKRRKPK